MLKVDGQSSLDARESYLKRRRIRRQLRARGVTVLWALLGAVLVWMAVIGVMAIDH